MCGQTSLRYAIYKHVSLFNHFRRAQTSPQVINSVIETIDAIRVTLGPAVILQYLLQGLFHPARRVRENFWKIYDNLYIGAQDGLVPFYPRVEDDMRNTYRIHELDLSL